MKHILYCLLFVFVISFSIDVWDLLHVGSWC